MKEITIDDLLEAFENYRIAKELYDIAKQQCQYDFYYFCSNEVEALDKVKEDLDRILSDYVVYQVYSRQKFTGVDRSDDD